MEDDTSISLAERRPRRLNRSLPKRFRDLLPQPPPSLPPAICSQPAIASPPSPSDNALPNTAGGDAESQIGVLSSRARIRQTFRTPRNIFGLVRQYFGERLPTSDPEELVTLADLSSTVSDTPIADHDLTSAPHNPARFYPYHNESSFCLGDWYWNGGVQKSQQSFRDLVDIIGDPKFNPSEIRNTNWDRINTTLASNVMDNPEEGWLDDEDAGWTKTMVKISVPFHRRMQNTGVRDYVAAELYHRSLVSVIKERISDPHAGAHFHMEPYELLWQPGHLPDEVKMHGELYTSQAFLEAHRALQDSPREPDCDLERVVVGLMFWSDSTHLTSFGNSHLWPLYLFIGNESKYRRCKPSCNLCSHVAYFEKVW